MKSLPSPPWAPLGERVSRPVGTGEGGQGRTAKFWRQLRATRWLRAELGDHKGRPYVRFRSNSLKQKLYTKLPNSRWVRSSHKAKS